jgi:hypothetical protein
MRLLDVDNFEVQSGYPDQDLADAKSQLWYESSDAATHTPKYAILSHRWRKGEEVKFQDFPSLPKEQLRDFPPQNPISLVPSSNPRNDQHNLSSIYKIAGACKEVLESEDKTMRHIWIDTVCINQGDSQELSTSINSMFRWYQNAEVCYVYMFDVSWDCTNLASSRTQFVKSDWFRRGWTLQELLAPKKLKFFDRDWKVIGSKDDLVTEIMSATGISAEHLGGSFHSASLGQKMSWLAGRTTERLEDRAYCVLGIFGIYLDARYGSGEDEFMRLQEEILKGWRKDVPFDESLFAWRAEQIESSGIFAPAPGCFRDAGDITFIPKLAKHRGQQMLTGPKFLSPGMEIDNAGQMTLMVPCLGFMPGAAATWILTFTSGFILTTVPAMIYQKARQHRKVQLNCWTKGEDGKLRTKKIKMEYNRDGRWQRVDCGKLYDSSSTKLYPSGWVTNRFCVKLNLTRKIKYKS